jgi:hypothetical protein
MRDKVCVLATRPTGDGSANRERALVEGVQLWPGGVQPLEPRQILNIRRELETGARGALREALFKTLVRGLSLLTASLHKKQSSDRRDNRYAQSRGEDI